MILEERIKSLNAQVEVYELSASVGFILFDCEKERVENVLQGMHFIDAAPVFLNPRRTSHNK